MTSTGQPNAPRAERSDVAIVGAGPAGSALAIRLADAGRSVTLLEAGCYDTPRIGESLAPDVQPLLRDLGLWEAVLATKPLPSWGTKSLWGGPDVDIHSHMIGPYGLGWHVDRRALDELMAEAARQRGADLRCGSPVAAVRHQHGSWELTLHDGGSVLRATVLIDATGRRGALARKLGAKRLVFDHLVGVGRIWSEVPASDDHVVVEATAEGWWYSAPVPGRGLVTLLMTDADIARTYGLTDPSRWARALACTRLTAPRATGATPNGRIRTHAALSARILRQDHRRWLAVGDAALAVDPLTGGGVVRALRTAAEAADSASDLVDAETSRCGAIIDRYEEARNRECDAYLNERLDFYAAGPEMESTFWSRRRQVALSRERVRAEDRRTLAVG